MDLLGELCITPGEDGYSKGCVQWCDKRLRNHIENMVKLHHLTLGERLFRNL